MARQRDVACASGHAFTTRANPRVRLRCPECRSWVLAPPIEEPWSPHWREQEGAGGGQPGAAPAGSAPPAEAHPAGGARVSKATATVAGARRTSPRPAQAPAERPDSDLTAAQQAGRRGGLSGGLRARMGRSR